MLPAEPVENCNSRLKLIFSMDQNLSLQLERIENKLDTIFKFLSFKELPMEMSDETDQLHFHWYHECKAAVHSDILQG